jgi:hypothetical protein
MAFRILSLVLLLAVAAPAFMLACNPAFAAGLRIDDNGAP